MMTMMTPALVKHRFEGVKVVNEAGQIDWLRKMTRVLTESYLDGTVSTRDQTQFSTPSGEQVSLVSDGIFETLGGVRWKVAQ